MICRKTGSIRVFSQQGAWDNQDLPKNSEAHFSTLVITNRVASGGHWVRICFVARISRLGAAHGRGAGGSR